MGEQTTLVTAVKYLEVSDFNWIDVITVSDADAQQEVIMSPEFRVVVTNTSGLEVLAAIHV